MSTYTVKYDKNPNRNYRKEIDEAAARGDFQTAAMLEMQRNNKIEGEGLNYPKTYEHIDIGTQMKKGMREGAAPETIRSMSNARINKANTTSGLEGFADDEIQRAAAEYINNGLSGAGVNLENRPVFDSTYKSKTDEILDKVLDADSFSYDINTDPLYNIYADKYTREGQRAMKDTLAQAAMGAGGNNSWAVSAAAQAQSRYMQELADKVPELYNLAYEKYLDDRSMEMNKLNILRDMENNEFNRYLNEMGIYQNDREFANMLTENDLNRYDSERTWKFNADQTERQWAEQVRAQEQAKVESAISAGVMPSDELLMAAGMLENKAVIEALVGQSAKQNNYNSTIMDIDLEQRLRDAALDKLKYNQQMGVYSSGVQKPVYTVDQPGLKPEDEGKITDNKNIDIKALAMIGMADDSTSFEEIEGMVERGEAKASIGEDGKIIVTPNYGYLTTPWVARKNSTGPYAV